MVSQLKVNEIIKQSGSSITIGEAGDTVSGPFTNVPAFEAYLSSDTSFSSSTHTKINCNTEVYDSDGCYDTSTYRFTPTVAGKYFVYGQARIECGTAQYDLGGVHIYKSGTRVAQFGFKHQDNNLTSKASPNGSIVLDMNGSTDYLELYVYANDSSGSPELKAFVDPVYPTYFGAYRIIGA